MTLGNQRSRSLRAAGARNSSRRSPAEEAEGRGPNRIVFDEGKGLSTNEQQYDPTSIINEVRGYVAAWRPNGDYLPSFLPAPGVLEMFSTAVARNFSE